MSTTYSPGLEGVIAAQTAISYIDGQAGQLIYQGYPIRKLVEQCSFEQVWSLLLTGDLPTQEAADALLEGAHDLQTLPQAVTQAIEALPADAPFMTVLRSALSITFAAWGLDSTIDMTPEQIERDCFRVAAITPLVIAAAYRLPRNLDLIEPQPGDRWTRHYLRLLTGKTPDDTQARAIERYMILVADHGLNASTFAARSVASTGTDVGSAVVAAVGALAGPLHGGAPSKVLEMFDEIGAAANAEAWVTEKIENSKKIMGFGHRVYKTYDPRADALKRTALEFDAPLAQYAAEVETTILETFEALKPGRGIATNVEYWSAVVLDMAGLPRDLFTPTFVAARMIGWTAHIREQLANNRIIRPKSQYIGPAERHVAVP